MASLLFEAGTLRNEAQFLTQSATWLICDKSGFYRFSVNSTSASRVSSSLKPTTVPNRRPSISGNATFIATSAGAKPPRLPSQASLEQSATGTCKTGQSSSSKNETRSPSFKQIEKLCIITTTSGRHSCAWVRSSACTAGLLSDNE